MNYQECQAYLEAAKAYGSVLGLENMRSLMHQLGNPQDSLNYIHVAGTNGKGSVIAYLYTILTEAGYRVGRYISPTLYTYRERMEACQKQVTEEEFARYLTRIAEAVEGMTAFGKAHPTVFELETAAAFLFFLDRRCDLVLLEVGMGGDLDATNIIQTTLLAVFTSISMDHEAFLGNTLEEIAQKKSGILKPGCHAVSTQQPPIVQEVLKKAAKRMKVPITFTDLARIQNLTSSLYGQRFCYQNETYDLLMAGVCQAENAMLALQALEILQTLGFSTTLAQRKHGLESTFWNGRFTVIHERPYVIVDGAHNPDAAQKLAASIQTCLQGKTIYYLMGVFRDKDYDTIIRRTYPYAKKIWTFATPGNPRALPAKELAQAVSMYHPQVVAAEDMHQAVAEAFAEAGSEDVILAFGSLSFIGELTSIVKTYTKSASESFLDR